MINEVYFTVVSSPVGKLTIASDGSDIVGLWIEGQKYFRARLPETAERSDSLPVFDRAKNWLNRYFNGDKPDPAELPLNPLGISSFQKEVYSALLEIPYGATSTYGNIAKKLNETSRKTSARAVGSAVGRNPVSIIIPCHRVLAADSSLCGYAAGLDKKRLLLKLEGVL